MPPSPPPPPPPPQATPGWTGQKQNAGDTYEDCGELQSLCGILILPPPWLAYLIRKTPPFLPPSLPPPATPTHGRRRRNSAKERKGEERRGGGQLNYLSHSLPSPSPLQICPQARPPSPSPEVSCQPPTVSNSLPDSFHPITPPKKREVAPPTYLSPPPFASPRRPTV